MLTSDEAAELAGFCDELEAAVRESAAREDARGAGAVSAAIGYGKGVAGYVGAVVSDSSSTVQRVVEKSSRSLRAGFDSAAGTAEARARNDSAAESAATPAAAAASAYTEDASAAEAAAEVAPTAAPPAAPVAAPRAARADAHQSEVSSMCGPIDPLRWRHRPLLFYGLTHAVAHGFTPMIMQKRGFVRRASGDLTYWHRAGRRRAVSEGKAGEDDPGKTKGTPAGGAAPEALVFIHGIGFGAAPYVERVERMAAAIDSASGPTADEADILMIELPAASQRAFSRMPPPADRFGQLVEQAMDSHGLPRAVVVGHSLGSVYATYLKKRDMREGRHRVGGVVLIDPIAVNMHHARSTREVIFTRLDSAQASFEDFLFKKELWTSTLVARHVPWHEASFWLDECVANVPTLIAVGSLDTIMSPRAASQGFGSWKARRKGVRVLTMEGMGHGGWLTSELAAESLVASIAALRIESASIAAADEFELTW